MTKIKILKNTQKLIYGFECSGHTMYAQSGKDIVCAGVSSLTQTAILGLTKVLKLSVNISRDDKNAFIKICVAKKDDLKLISAQVVLETMVLGLKEIENQYPNFVKLEELYENV